MALARAARFSERRALRPPDSDPSAPGTAVVPTNVPDWIAAGSTGTTSFTAKSSE
jgi:hypothetical protein